MSNPPTLPPMPSLEELELKYGDPPSSQQCRKPFQVAQRWYQGYNATTKWFTEHHQQLTEAQITEVILSIEVLILSAIDDATDYGGDTIATCRLGSLWSDTLSTMATVVVKFTWSAKDISHFHENLYELLRRKFGRKFLSRKNFWKNQHNDDHPDFINEADRVMTAWMPVPPEWEEMRQIEEQETAPEKEAEVAAAAEHNKEHQEGEELDPVEESTIVTNSQHMVDRIVRSAAEHNNEHQEVEEPGPVEEPTIDVTNSQHIVDRVVRSAAEHAEKLKDHAEFLRHFRDSS